MESFVEEPEDFGSDDPESANKLTSSAKDETKPQEDKIVSQLPFVASLAASNLIYLLTLISLHNCYRTRPNRRWRQIVYGSIAGIVSAFCTTPLWVANTRLNAKRKQTLNQTKSNSTDIPKPMAKLATMKSSEMIEELVKIGKMEGIGGLWSGINTSLLLAIINSPLQQIIERLLRQMQSGKGHRKLTSPPSQPPPSPGLSLGTIILSSIISRCATTALTYPLILVQSQQRFTGNRPNQTTESSLNILKQIVQDQGPLGLYHGIESKLKQTTVVAGLVALTQPKILYNILNRLLTAIDQNDPEGKRRRRRY